MDINIIAGCRVVETLREDNRIGIYRATQPRADATRSVILKALRAPHPSLDDVAQLRHEFDIAQRLPFPGVVQALDIVPHGNGVALLLEDFGGVSLHDFLKQNNDYGLNLELFFLLALQLVATLEQIHARGVVHKDIKPDNLLFNVHTGQIKLGDFGIASLQETEMDAQRMQGTLAYMSPEQTGRLNQVVDFRSDFYSLGITFFQLLTGKLPFNSPDAMEMVHCHIAKTPPAPHEFAPSVPKVLSDIVLKLLAKSARERYGSARGLAADLSQCQAQWRDGTIADFPLGRFDRFDELQLSTRLYGREGDLSTLSKAFEEAANGERELVMIAGYSGIGKTALVGEIQGTIKARNGFFITGKFDQFRRNVPYDSLIEAFRALIRQVLTGSEAELDKFKSRLLAAVGENGQLLVEVMPELELVIGPQAPVPTLGPQESQNRFHFVLQGFVRVWSDADHPLVVFLDDLQWADSASLKFLQALLLDGQCHHLLMIGAYRDNEVTPSHPLLLALEEMRKSGVTAHEVFLAPLELPHVCQWLEDSLGCSTERVAPLAALLLQRTQGNPFFLGQLLHSLHERKLLQCEGGEWSWNIKAITEANLTGDVVELMSGKIQTLSLAAQNVLKLAACVGNRFDARTLSMVSGQSPAQIGAGLQDARLVGLITSLDEPSVAGESASSFKFLHDRVQQAAYSLVETNERPAIHLQIGRLLLEHSSANERETRVFDIVNHLNIGRELITETDEIRQLVRLNLEAGQRAKASAAHGAALSYFCAGQEMAPPEFWNSDYETLFSLVCERSQSAYFEGHLEEAERAFEFALSRAKTPLDRALVETTRVQLYITRSEYGRAIEVGRQGLLALGVRLPLQAGKTAIVRALLSVKRHRGRRAAADILRLPRISDPRLLAQMQLMESLTLALYLSGEQNLFVLLSLRMVETSLREGTTEFGCSAYSNYGVILGLALGDFKTGLEFGAAAIQLAQEFGSRHRLSSTMHIYAGLLLFWRRPLRESEAIFRESHALANETGNVVLAGYSATTLISYMALRGAELDELDQEIERFLPFFRGRRDADQWIEINIARQFGRNLQGRTPHLSSFDGEELDEQKLLATFEKGEVGDGCRCHYFLDKARACYFWGDFAGALDMARRAEKTLGALTATVYTAEWNFFYSLALAGVHEKAGDEDKKLFARQIRKNQKQMRKWAHNCPPNFAHKLLLVSAEIARISGRDEEAGALYDASIREARAAQYTQNEALANEAAARFYSRKERPQLARAYAQEARYLYQKWGAHAKAADLEHHFPQLDSSSPAANGSLVADTQDTTDGTGSGKTSALDLATVVKAAQTLSGEIDLGRLLQRLLRFALENAGATRGFLVLEQNGRLQIEAVGAVGENEENLVALSSLPLESSRELPLSLVQYVARTRENVVLHDATRDALFRADSYIVRHGPKSVLCAPILSQNKLTGLIYLENNLTAGAFTPARLEVLKVLSAQAAISLQNARLYGQLEEYSRTLEARVEERTKELLAKNGELEQTLRELKEMQNRVIVQEKMASLGALTAGIAHEIKNPLNFVVNFAALSVELSDELGEELEKLAASLDAKSRDYLSEILSDLRSNAQKINEHGARADSIVRNMLLHSRGQTSDFEAVDLNALVREAVQLAYHGQRANDSSFNVSLDEHFAADLERVRVLPHELSRVILNLANNAFYATNQKARREGSGFAPRVGATTSKTEAGVEIRIQDNGDGIPDKVREKIFTPFFTTKPAGEGTGLGLSMSYDIIVQQHGGDIRVESTPGEGTELIVVLPTRKGA